MAKTLDQSRNINRIDPFCKRLAKAWKTLPDYSFNQLFYDVLTELAADGIDPFYIEDEQMISIIEQAVQHYKKVS